MVRRASTEKFERIEHIREQITLHQGRPARPPLAGRHAARIAAGRDYNLAAMSFVAVSWIQPTLTAEFTGANSALSITRAIAASISSRSGASGAAVSKRGTGMA